MSLTGGTKDVNPQYFHMTATQSSADAATTTAFPIPVQRLNNRGRAMVMEVLKVFWSTTSLVEVDSSLSGWLTTSSAGSTATDYSNTKIIDSITKQRYITTSGTFSSMDPIIHDLTDGAGHGLLVATDVIYLQVSSATTSAANTIRCKVLYRWKDVGMSEYIGIVQSQQ